MAPDGMARNFALNFPHTFGTAEAQWRVGQRLDRLRTQFGDKIGSSEINWIGNEAHIRVLAFMQTATAEVLVTETNVQIVVHLPLVLSPLSGKISGFLKQVAHEELRRGTR